MDAKRKIPNLKKKKNKPLLIHRVNMSSAVIHLMGISIVNIFSRKNNNTETRFHYFFFGIYFWFSLFKNTKIYLALMGFLYTGLITQSTIIY